MHRNPLCIALVVLVLAVGSAQAEGLNIWHTVNQGQQPPYPFVMAGGSEPGHTLYVCRAIAPAVFLNLAGLLTPGKTWPGLDGCFVGAEANPSEQLITPYQVLLTPPLVDPRLITTWRTRAELRARPDLVSNAVQGGYSINGTNIVFHPDLHICRAQVTVNGNFVGVHPGQLQLFLDNNGVWDGNCAITYGGEPACGACPDWDILLYQ